MAEWVRALDWRPDGPGFESHCGKTFRFGTLAIPFTPLCQCLSEETLKATHSINSSQAGRLILRFALAGRAFSR